MSSYYKSSSKASHVTCRIEACSKSIVKQNYKMHLETKHPNEDSNDLREKGQPKLFFTKKIKVSASEKCGKDSENADDKMFANCAVKVKHIDDQCSDNSNYIEP